MKLEVKALGDCMTLINGRAYLQHELLNSGTPVLRIQNLNGGDNWYYSNLSLPGDKYCENGDLLFAWSATFGPYLFNGPKSIYHYHIWKIIPKKNILDKGFAFYMLVNITQKVKDEAHGISMLHITKSKMEAMQIPLPPLNTQKKIAAVLDAADAYRQLTKTLIEKYNQLAQSLFLDMFGDPVRNEKGWKFEELNHLVTKLGDGLHGTPVYSDQGEYYFINGNNLDNGKISISEATKRVDKSEYYKHKKDLDETTMFVSINGTLGKVAFYNNEKIILGKSACYFNIKKGSINPIYLYRIISSPYFLNYAVKNATGTTIQNVSLKTMRTLPVPIPPITLQNQFADRIQLIEAQKQQAQASLQKSEDLFNSLLQRAFKGELVD